MEASMGQARTRDVTDFESWNLDKKWALCDFLKFIKDKSFIIFPVIVISFVHTKQLSHP